MTQATSRSLWLELRTPSGQLYNGAVRRVRAEDLDGWFGVLPGRPDLIAALAPGLMLFEDDESEAFVANAGGMLDLESGVCRVVLRSAVITRSSDDIGDAIARQREARQLQISTEGALLDALLSEALRRATESEPEQWSRPR